MRTAGLARRDAKPTEVATQRLRVKQESAPVLGRMLASAILGVGAARPCGRIGESIA